MESTAIPTENAAQLQELRDERRRRHAEATAQRETIRERIREREAAQDRAILSGESASKLLAELEREAAKEKAATRTIEALELGIREAEAALRVAEQAEKAAAVAALAPERLEIVRRADAAMDALCAALDDLKAVRTAHYAAARAAGERGFADHLLNELPLRRWLGRRLSHITRELDFGRDVPEHMEAQEAQLLARYLVPSEGGAA